MQLIVLPLHFIAKAASAALFGLLLLIAFALTAPMGSNEYFGFFRYDYLLFYALIIQACLIYLKLESWAEAKVIALFHIMAMGMEIFLTHPAIASWQYPQPAVFKLLTVPLFAGFMYSAVGSFFARSLRLYQVAFEHLPRFSNMLCLAVLSYLNFMTKFLFQISVLHYLSGVSSFFGKQNYIFSFNKSILKFQCYLFYYYWLS